MLPSSLALSIERDIIFVVCLPMSNRLWIRLTLSQLKCYFEHLNENILTLWIFVSLADRQFTRMDLWSNINQSFSYCSFVYKNVVANYTVSKRLFDHVEIHDRALKYIVSGLHNNWKWVYLANRMTCIDQSVSCPTIEINLLTTKENMRHIIASHTNGVRILQWQQLPIFTKTTLLEKRIVTSLHANY